MSSLSLPPRAAPEQATEYFRRRRLGNCFGLLAPAIRIATQDDQSSRKVPFIERLWLPAYAVCLRTELREKYGTIWTSVDGLSGHFAFLDDIGDLEPRKLAEEAFAPGFAQAQAEEIARKSLLQFILRQRGQFNKPVIDGVEEVRPYHYPVWVYYHRRGRFRLDLEVFDAYAGRPGGARMRMALVNALIAARKQRESQRSV